MINDIDMATAIYYSPDGFKVIGNKIMGRQVAGNSFLKAYFRYSDYKEFWVYSNKKAEAEDFARFAREQGRNEKIKFINFQNTGNLKEPGLLFYPGPSISLHAKRRSFYKDNSWSLCGITHTTSSGLAMDSITDLITSPVQSWDALICTSTSVKKNVESLLESQINYLKDRLGITKITLPKLPIIPLGIHTDEFLYTREQKSISRQKLGVNEETIVVLYTGRLSFHAKAHPMAMYRALEKATNETKKEVVLIECGWHANDSIEKIFKQTALETCPSIRVVTLDGRKEENRNLAWASADIFCSLSDNIQETFGIVPIEAMAAGLPVVVSDWDGYKDSVRNGKEGFRIPTYMPEAGLGKDLAYRHGVGIDNYDMYCGLTCSLISVDINATTKAFEKLFKSKDLREEMGNAGKKRAREKYDWKVIINQYEDLWSQQNEIRKKNSSSIKELKYPWPGRMDPFYSFASYPTNIIKRESKIRIMDQNIDQAIGRINTYKNNRMINFAKYIYPSQEEITKLLKALGNQTKSVGEIIDIFPENRKGYSMRTIGWLIKFGILEIN